MRKSIIKTIALATGSALILLVAMAGSVHTSNSVTDFTGLGTVEQNFYGTAQINPGYNTTNGSGTLTLITGANPQAEGSVTFKLWSSPAGFPQPCVFGVGYHNDIGLPDQFWPFGSQVGWYDTTPRLAKRPCISAPMTHTRCSRTRPMW